MKLDGLRDGLGLKDDGTIMTADEWIANLEAKAEEERDKIITLGNQLLSLPQLIEEAYTDLAASLNRSVDKLTAAQKQRALLNHVIEVYNGKAS